MKQRMHRIIVWMMIMFLAVSGTAAYAQTGADSVNTTNTANATVKITFPDTITHWSQKHVAKLAALGIVKGKSDGTYGTNDNISQQEVIIMAVRLMGAEAEAIALDNVGTSLQVDDWAKQYVLYALREGIIVPSEEMVNEGYANWGTRSAKREWVAKVMVRALGKESDSQAAANIPTSFNDNADISSDALGYVNAAVKLGIITGTTTNDFLPLKTITRAETASIFAKAEQYLPQSEQVVSGYVSSVNNDSLYVRDPAGEIHYIPLTSQTAYYRYDQNFQVLRSDLSSGRQVYTVKSNGSAIYVEITSDEDPTETISGELFAVDTSSQIIKVIVDGTEVSYLLEDNVGVIDADGTGSSLSLLIPKSKIELKKSTVSNRIVEIHVKDKPVSKSSSGVIAAISENEITIQDAISGQTETYPLSEQILATYNDAILMLSDLTVSDTVTYKVVNGLVTEIVVTAKYVAPKRGTVNTIDADNDTIVIRNLEGKLEAYDMADNVQVQLDGMAAPSINDLFPGDTVTLTFNSSEMVSVIKIENRTISSSQMLKFITYIEESNEIVVLDVNSKSNTLKLKDDTILEVYGMEYPITELTRYVTANQRIDLVLTGEYVQRIKRSDSYTGTVKDYNPTTRRLVLNNPSIGDIQLNLSSTAYVQIMNKPSTALTDVSIGDEVKVILGQDQMTVSQIQVKTNVKYTIDSVNAITRLLTIRDSSNNVRNLSLGSNIQIKHPDKPFASINDLKAGQTITVSYYGTSVASVNLLAVSYGTIESVDRLNNKLTVLTNDNKIVQVDTKAKFELYKGNEKIAVNTLLRGDRISIMQDSEGYTYATVVLKQLKIVYKLETGNQISFTNPMSEVEKMNLAENVIVRSGNALVDLTTLKSNDRVYVYIVDKQVVEIEKI